MAGCFITFEGVEGAGKSTQIKLLKQHLDDLGYDVLLTREPGGTQGAEAIRTLLVEGGANRWTDLSECLLMNAARNEHLEHVIRPALAQGQIVICDRFMDSSRAYQGFAGGIEIENIRQIENIVVKDTLPDLTLIFDMPVEEGLARAEQRGGSARFESKGVAYHNRVRQGFLTILSSEPQRCQKIEAAQPIEVIAQQVKDIVLPVIERCGSQNVR